MKTTYGLKISFFVALFLLGSFARGQDIASVPAAKAACGPENVKFQLTLDDGQQSTLNPENGKAVIYIFQDFPRIRTPFEVTTRIGADGTWVGANHGRSFFSFMIDPGEHHLCVSGQWGRLTSPPSIALHRVLAKAGEIYCFRVGFLNHGAAGVSLSLELVDEDQAQFLLQTSLRSTSHPE